MKADGQDRSVSNNKFSSVGNESQRKHTVISSLNISNIKTTLNLLLIWCVCLVQLPKFSKLRQLS